MLHYIMVIKLFKKGVVLMKILTDNELKKCVGGSVWSTIGEVVGTAGYWVLKGLGNMSDVNQADRINRKKRR